MFARVLFPTDFSAYANATLACLPELKSAGMGVVTLLYVIRATDVPLPETVNRESLKRVRWSAEEQLHIARLALEGQGLRVFTRVEYGSPAEQIVRVADEERIDLIVIGAQGYTVAQELLLGSVAPEVVPRPPAPVLVQKFDVIRELGHVECRRVCAQMFRRVLHPTDFSECAHAAFQLVKQLKAAGTEEVLVLHVQDERAMQHRPAKQLADFDRTDRERLEGLCRALQLFGLRARALLRHGVPFQETLKTAAEENPDLIVLGSRGRSAIQEILAGSTLESVVRLARHPVLVVKCP